MPSHILCTCGPAVSMCRHDTDVDLEESNVQVDVVRLVWTLPEDTENR